MLGAVYELSDLGRPVARLPNIKCSNQILRGAGQSLGERGRNSKDKPDQHVTDCTRFWCNVAYHLLDGGPVQIREIALWVLGVNGCTSALQAEGNRFDTDKIHFDK